MRFAIKLLLVWDGCGSTAQQFYISENLMSAQHEDYYSKNTCYCYKHTCITLNGAQRGQAMKRLSWIKTGTFKSRMSILLNP